MLINFALDKLGTKISCNKVSTDDFEAANLILSQTTMRPAPQGFLAEHFIKPPVSLTLKFPCPVNISHIILDPQVGSQRSSLFHIYTASSGKKSNASGSSVSRGLVATESKEMNDLTLSGKQTDFNKVGCFCSIPPGRILFINNRYETYGSVTTRGLEAFPGNIQYQSELRHSSWQALASVDILVVRIVATSNGSTPALGLLQVWGKPAASCPKHLQDHIYQQYTERACFGMQTGTHAYDPNDANKDKNRKRSLSRIACEDTGQSLSCPQSEKVSKSAAALPCASGEESGLDDDNTPEDFLDALTFEIMSFPMLLPSGHSVDISSLHKCTDAQGTHGQMASDPFTGLPFTESRLPKFNKPLKKRIDEYLQQNAHKLWLQNVPRTVGTAENETDSVRHFRNFCSTDSTPKLEVKKHKIENDSPSSNMTVRQNNSTRIKQHEKSVSETFTPSHVNLTTKTINTEGDIAGATTEREETTKTEGDSANTTAHTEETSCLDGQSDQKPSEVNSTKSDDKSHEDCLRSSLTNSLASVLQQLPSFTGTSCDQQTGEEGKCVICKAVSMPHVYTAMLGLSFVMYSFPCQHKICRKCVSRSKISQYQELLCTACNKSFKKCEINRSHSLL